MTLKILDEILGRLPKEAEIVETAFEGANIILYTKNKDFFLDDHGIIRDIVNTIKKRVELRPDPSLCLDPDKSKEIIQELVQKEAGISNIFFDSFRSVVTIEAEKPGIAIGRAGEVLKEIRRRTLWVPMIARTPALRSKIIENIRQVLYENSEQRKKFLNQVGKKIYEGWVNERKVGSVKLTFLGAGREVGRSCIFLQTPESKVLLDCGLNTAANDESAYPILDIPEFNIKEIDAIIISHAHLDHVAFLPYLIKYGFSGPIYCTAPTRDVMALLQLDFIAVGQKEARKALYSSSEIKQMVKQTICLDYEEVTDITSDIRLTLYNSGHTLGSAQAHLHIGNGLHNLLYTGDLKFETSNLLPSAVTRFPRLETVILESTYGAKDDVQPSRQEAEQYLLDVVRTTVNRKGKILMPILGVGRSQEMMLIIERAIREGTIDKIPIYVQGMVWDVTAIHTAYPEFFDKKIRKSVFHKDYNPFLSDVFKRVASLKEMQDVLDYEGPCIIIATSGMMSVDGNEPILFKNSNNLKVGDVGEIINKTINKATKKGIIVGKVEGEMAIPNNNLQVPCYDLQTGKLEFKPVSVVIKHKVNEPLYYLKLNSGRGVKVTGSHSVMVLKDGFITSKKVEELTEEDYVVINKKVDSNRNIINVINLAERLLENCPKDILSKIYIKNDSNAKKYTSWGRKYKTSALLNYTKEIKLSKKARIGLKAATDITVPYEIQITKELVRLLGYFVSEGCYYTSKFRCGDVKLSFGIHETLLAKDAAECVRKVFGINPKIVKDPIKNTLTVQFGSKLFAYVFKFAFDCQSGAGNKRIPPTIFNLNETLQKEFLKGYFLGDGSFYNKNKRVALEFTSKSKKLMSDIMLLLAIIGIPVHKLQKITKKERFIRNRLVKESFLYRIQITNPLYLNKLNFLPYKIKSNRQFIESNPFSIPVKEIKALFNGIKLNENLKRLKWNILGRKRIGHERLKILVEALENSSNNKELLESLRNISKGYLGFDKIKEINKVKATDSYVYDFSIDKVENFLAGHGGVLLHNTGGPSVSYFKEMADNPRNSLVFTCYQGEGSLGRRIQNGEKEIVFSNGTKPEIAHVKLDVFKIMGFSGHSDRAQLINFVYKLSPKPRRVILNHGESSKCLDLASSLHKLNNIETIAPKNLETIRIR